MWTYRDRRNRAAFSNAQLAYDRAVDPNPCYRRERAVS